MNSLDYSNVFSWDSYLRLTTRKMKDYNMHPDMLFTFGPG